MTVKWRFGIIAGLFLAIYSFYPQAKLLYNRGADWNLNYAYNDVDEVAYAAYIQALIDGRPRKNDPFTGRDNSPDTPLAESLFSIQFAAPYTVALPARLLGVSTPWAMTISGMAAAFLTAVAIFWLIAMIFKDNWYAMAGSLAVLVGGALFAGEGASLEIFFGSYAYPYFPGFRRYLPAMAFPAFFWLVGLVWKLLDRDDQGSILVMRVSGCVLLFAYAVYSYFYVWTTAAAWLACLGAVLIVAKWSEKWEIFRWLGSVSVGCLVALIPYAYLISRRSLATDDSQLLVFTHVPDLARVPELISFCVLLALGAGILFKEVDIRDKAVLFTASLALSVFVVFNQQIVTGRQLQSIHYQVFIGNYVAGLALALTLGIYLRPAFQRARKGALAFSAVLTMIAISWGFVEAHYTASVVDDANVRRDQIMPTCRAIAAKAFSQGKVLLANDIVLAEEIPSHSDKGVVWAPHQFVFQSSNESEPRFFAFLYLLNYSPDRLRGLLHYDVQSRRTIFGWGRDNRRLTSEPKGITEPEINAAVERYQSFVEGFDRSSAKALELSGMVVHRSVSLDLTRISEWYDVGPGEPAGEYVIYPTTLK